MIYIYLPFRDGALIDSSFSLYNRIYYKFNCERIDKKELTKVKPDDLLYVFGHGARGDNNIYGTDSKTFKFSAEDLASQVGKRLDKAHKKIKIWVCFSAYGINEKKGLAYNFWKKMRELEFDKLTVYGYTTAIADPISKKDHKLAIELKEGFINLRETPDKFVELGRASKFQLAINENGDVLERRK